MLCTNISHSHICVHSSTSQFLRIKDRLYKHPVYNYGPEYRAQLESVVDEKFKDYYADKKTQK